MDCLSSTNWGRRTHGDAEEQIPVVVCRRLSRLRVPDAVDLIFPPEKTFHGLGIAPWAGPDSASTRARYTRKVLVRPTPKTVTAQVNASIEG